MLPVLLSAITDYYAFGILTFFLVLSLLFVQVSGGDGIAQERRGVGGARGDGGAYAENECAGDKEEQGAFVSLSHGK